jgi:hypothetical protein
VEGGNAQLTDIVTILRGASANGTGFTLDAGDLKGTESLEVFTAGTVSAFSVQLQGSLDGTNWTAIGAAVTTAGTTAVAGAPLARWFRAVLSGFSGTGTVTVVLGYSAGFTAAAGGAVTITAQSGAPSGTPSPAAGTVAAVFDTVTNQLFIYNGGWKAVTVS